MEGSASAGAENGCVQVSNHPEHSSARLTAGIWSVCLTVAEQDLTIVGDASGRRHLYRQVSSWCVIKLTTVTVR